MAARRTTRANNHHVRTQGKRASRGALDRHKRGIAARLEQLRGDRPPRPSARALGVFQPNVNRYESGTTPHADFLITLAIQENVSLDWLLLGKGRPRRR